MVDHTLSARATPAMTVDARLGRVLCPVAAAFRIRDERPRDAFAREALLDLSFGLQRFARTCERLREGRLPAQGLSFVATTGSTIVGTLRLWHVDLGRAPALMLGPLAVDTAQRSAGIGRALVEHGLKRARALGHTSVILVGDAPYYARFGFSRVPAGRLQMPGPVDPARFLGLELQPAGLAGAEGRVVATGPIADRREMKPLRLAA